MLKLEELCLNTVSKQLFDKEIKRGYFDYSIFYFASLFQNDYVKELANLSYSPDERSCRSIAKEYEKRILSRKSFIYLCGVNLFIDQDSFFRKPLIKALNGLNLNQHLESVLYITMNYASLVPTLQQNTDQYIRQLTRNFDCRIKTALQFQDYKKYGKELVFFEFLIHLKRMEIQKDKTSPAFKKIFSQFEDYENPLNNMVLSTGLQEAEHEIAKWKEMFRDSFENYN